MRTYFVLFIREPDIWTQSPKGRDRIDGSVKVEEYEEVVGEGGGERTVSFEYGCGHCDKEREEHQEDKIVGGGGRSRDNLYGFCPNPNACVRAYVWTVASNNGDRLKMIGTTRIIT